ncbi:MAG: type II toxin-antitoxin system ParD family antitoxin [Aquisalinus sp.]|nr:type II toxin-antitoxin system ParD family antitoxin [Aquisalinus sp.]
MQTLKITLSDQLLEWLDGQVRVGDYADTDDYISGLIEQERERLAKRDALQGLVAEGFSSGPAETFDHQQFLNDIKK